MKWSVNSDMLALVVAAPQASATGLAGQRAVQIWQRSNWHWYLKHETRHATDQVWQDAAKDKLKQTRWKHVTFTGNASLGLMALLGQVIIEWDEVRQQLLHNCTTRAQLTQQTFLQQYTVSERGTAAVIDGRQLLLTPLQHELAPPPMCSVAARCRAPVISTSFWSGAGPEVKLKALQADRCSC